MGVIKAAVTVGLFTLLSRVAGFFRECTFAYCLGASIYSDALVVALKLSNTFRRIFAEGAFNASFLPRFAKVYTVEGQEKANVVLSHTFSFLLLSLISFSGFIILFYPTVLNILVHGFEPGSLKFNLSLNLGRICFPYLIFISLASLFAGVLNTINKFALAAGAYSILSIFTTIGILLGYLLGFSSEETVYITAVFVLLSGLTQSIILYRGIRKHGFKVFFTLKCWSIKVIDIMKNMIPGIIGAGVWQLNLLADMAISSYLPTGTITCVSLADRLNQFPLGTIGIAVSTALLPILSKYIAAKNFEKATQELKEGLLFVNFLIIFCAALLLSLAEPAVSVAFQRGLFEIEQVKITTSIVLGFAIGLPAYVLSKVFAALFFAVENTRTPVIFGFISVFINIISMILLIPFLKYFGIAFCTSLSSIANTSLLIFHSRKILKVEYSKNFWYKTVAQVVSGILTFLFFSKLSDTFWKAEYGMSAKKWPIVIAFVLAGAFVYFVSNVFLLKCLKQKELRLWKKEAWRQDEPPQA